LKIVKSVTQKLIFLCIGENAGPTKIKKAKGQNVDILTPHEHVKMFQTGKLPNK